MLDLDPDESAAFQYCFIQRYDFGRQARGSVEDCSLPGHGVHRIVLCNCRRAKSEGGCEQNSGEVRGGHVLQTTIISVRWRGHSRLEI